MTKTEWRSVSPIFAVTEKAMRGVRPRYESRANTIDLASELAPLRLLRYRPCTHLARPLWPTWRALPFQPHIEQVFFHSSCDEQPGTRRGYGSLHSLEQIVELPRRRVGRHGRRIHVVCLEQVGKICFTLHLPEKLVHAEPALLAHEFDHEFDVVLQGIGTSH